MLIYIWWLTYTHLVHIANSGSGMFWIWWPCTIKCGNTTSLGFQNIHAGWLRANVPQLDSILLLYKPVSMGPHVSPSERFLWPKSFKTHTRRKKEPPIWNHSGFVRNSGNYQKKSTVYPIFNRTHICDSLLPSAKSELPRRQTFGHGLRIAGAEMVQILPNRTGAMREMITGFASGKIKGNLWPMAYGFVASKTICVGHVSLLFS